MFKLGLALIFVVFLACNFYESAAQAEDPEKQEDVIVEKRAALREPWVKSDDGIFEEEEADDDDETAPRDVPNEEG